MLTQIHFKSLGNTNPPKFQASALSSEQIIQEWKKKIEMEKGI